MARKYVEEQGGGAFDLLRFGINAPVYRIIRAQLIATILASLSCLYFDWVAAYSILSGGTVCVVPAAFAAWRLSSKTAGAKAAMIHTAIAETGKLLFTIVLFIVTFVFIKPLNLLLFFGSIITLHSLYILVPMIDTRGIHLRIRD